MNFVILLTASFLFSMMLFAIFGAAGIVFSLWYLFQKQTVSNEDLVKELGKIRRTPKIRGTAVVCGGSISGILSARVCADHFERVLLVDPEFTKAQNGGEKTRIMQYTSMHGYLNVFATGLRKLWPDMDKRVVEIVGDGNITSADYKAHYDGLYLKAPYESYKPRPFPTSFFMRRFQMERVMQSLLLEHSPNVEILDGTFRSVKVSPDGTRVDSVVVRDLEGKSVTIDDPSLVIDCTGASQAGIKSLISAGYPIPEQSYDNKMVYITVLFSPPPGISEQFPIPSHLLQTPTATLIGKSPTRYNPRTCGMVRVDNGKYQICYTSYGHVPIPRTTEELKTPGCFGPDLPDWAYTTLKLLVEHGSPKFEVVKLPPCSRYKLQDAKGLPSNFIAIGDSAMKLNPLNGQGVSKSVISVAVLQKLLLESATLNNFGHWFHTECAKRVDPIWDGVKTSDYGYATTIPIKGETLDSGKFGRWYGDKVARASSKDEPVARALWHVSHLLRPATDLMMPRVIWGVIKHNYLSRG